MSRKGSDLVTHEDGKARCWWCGTDADYVAYHDHEWGQRTLPGMDDDTRHFEKIALEGFQAGLSWLTILRKRDAFRSAFHEFDIARISRMTERNVTKLLSNAGIVRHRGKIEATINNAKAALLIQREHGSFADWLWLQVESSAAEKTPPPRSRNDLPAQTTGSTHLSKRLRKRGFRFVGPTTMYAFMQSVGMVNDHIVGCAFRAGH